MQSDFLLQVVNRHTGEVVSTWEPGGSVEANLVHSCVVAAKARGIGFWRTEAQVERALRAAWSDVLHALKSQVQPAGR